jgi:predicted nucleic acid-binding protein
VALRVLDTNIASYVFKGHALAAKYKRHLIGHTLAISFMTVGEMLEGALRAKWSDKRTARLTAHLQLYLWLHSDPDICEKWADVRFERRLQPISTDDGWIAATALAHGADLVTHNPDDFHSITGLSIVSEVP